MFLARPLDPEDFRLQQRILMDRIARNRVLRRLKVVADDETNLRALVTAQLDAEVRAERAARQAAARRDPRQADLLDSART